MLEGGKAGYGLLAMLWSLVNIIVFTMNSTSFLPAASLLATEKRLCTRCKVMKRAHSGVKCRLWRTMTSSQIFVEQSTHPYWEVTAQWKHYCTAAATLYLLTGSAARNKHTAVIVELVWEGFSRARGGTYDPAGSANDLRGERVRRPVIEHTIPVQLSGAPAFAESNLRAVMQDLQPEVITPCRNLSLILKRRHQWELDLDL